MNDPHSSQSPLAHRVLSWNLDKSTKALEVRELSSLGSSRPARTRTCYSKQESAKMDSEGQIGSSVISCFLQSSVASTNKNFEVLEGRVLYLVLKYYSPNLLLMHCVLSLNFKLLLFKFLSKISKNSYLTIDLI
jgi:hypothetical protein